MKILRGPVEALVASQFAPEFGTAFFLSNFGAIGVNALNCSQANVEAAINGVIFLVSPFWGLYFSPRRT